MHPRFHIYLPFFFSSRRRHTRCYRDWSSDVCSSDLTVEKRDGMRSFLRQHGYRIGRATVDASDWAINTRLENRVRQNSKADLSPYRDFFLQHIWERAQFYESLAERVPKHPVRHTVLLHHNPINAFFLDDLIRMVAL